MQHGIETGRGAELTPTNPATLRLGAAAGVLGAVAQIWLGGLHAGTVDPNNSPTVFVEYFGSSIWTLVHVGQYFGTFLIAFAFLTIARSMRNDGGLTEAFAGVGAVAVTVVLAIFAVQMAVDGVALRESIAAWVLAPEPDRAAAYLVAESVRWIEKGLSAFFQLNNGTMLVALGLAVSLGRRYPRWLGIVALGAGVAALAGGLVVARTGFSPQGAAILGPASIAGAVFLVGIGVSMWRAASRTSRGRAVANAPAAA
jgi:hypothetical protein